MRVPPPLSPPPGAGQSSPPDGLGSQAQQGFAWPEPSSVLVDHAASRVRFAGKFKRGEKHAPLLRKLGRATD
jgi:hypothetical protein